MSLSEMLSLLVSLVTLAFLIKYVRATTTIATATVAQHEAILRPVVVISPTSLRGRASTKQVFEQIDHNGEAVAELSPSSQFCVMTIGSGPALDVVVEVWPGIKDQPLRYFLPPLGVSRDTAVAPLCDAGARNYERVHITYSSLNGLAYRAEYQIDDSVVRSFRESRIQGATVPGA